MNGYDLLSNAKRAQASLGQNQLSLPRWAEISSYDQNTGAVKVTIQPEGKTSGWMPLGALGVGNGCGVAVGPNVGDLVMVVFAEGDFNSGAIIGRFFSTQNQAIPVPSGEVWAVHKTGSFMKMLTNGDISFNAVGNFIAAVTGNMTATVTGNTTIQTAIAAVVASVSAAITAPTISIGAAGQSLKTFVTNVFISLFNGHTHKINATGSQSDPPLQQMAEGTHTTTTIKGG